MDPQLNFSSGATVLGIYSPPCVFSNLLHSLALPATHIKSAESFLSGPFLGPKSPSRRTWILLALSADAAPQVVRLDMSEDGARNLAERNQLSSCLTSQDGKMGPMGLEMLQTR